MTHGPSQCGPFTVFATQYHKPAGAGGAPSIARAFAPGASPSLAGFPSRTRLAVP